MGAIYSVSLDFKCKDRYGLTKVLNDSVQSLLDECHDAFGTEALRTGSIDDCLYLMLACFQDDFEYEIEEDGSEYYFSNFKATYSWLEILEDMFKAMAPYLEDGSIFTISCGSDDDTYKVIGGRLKLIESSYQEIGGDD